MLALGLLVIVVLALTALGITALRSTSKSTSSQVAAQVLHRELSRAVYSVPGDAAFWGSLDCVDTPWKTGKVTVGAEDFSYAIYMTTVRGTGPPNRLRKLDVLVRWRDGSRVGYGELQARGSQLVNEAP